MPTVRRKHRRPTGAMTVDTFDAFVEAQADGLAFEFVNGELVMRLDRI